MGAMVEEVIKAQTKVGVGIEAFWKALAIDMRVIAPKVVPNIVEKVELIEGDGGLGTVLLFTFGPGVTAVRYQKEKIVELDDCAHQIGLQVVEGGHLTLGFSSYKTTIQLNAIGEEETCVDVAVIYEAETPHTQTMLSNTINSSLGFIKQLETYLLSRTS